MDPALAKVLGTLLALFGHMNTPRHRLAHPMAHMGALAFLLSFPLLGGCFSSGGTPDGGVDAGPDVDERCRAQKMCAAVDAIGCCGAPQAVSVCDPCPTGTIEQAECRTAGCNECDAPLICHRELEAGCCGVRVGNTSCNVCPEGSMPVDDCGEHFPACGCGPEFDARPAPGVPVRPPDAGMPDASAHADAAPFDAGRPECREDLGDGCCGAFVTYESECGCPRGSIHETECTGSIGDGIILPSVSCFQDLGGGCCGGFVEPNACSGECPAGTLDESSCAAHQSGDAPAEAPPIALCHQDLGAGCCGDMVPLDACGACPEGSTQECTDFAPACGG